MRPRPGREGGAGSHRAGAGLLPRGRGGRAADSPMTRSGPSTPPTRRVAGLGLARAAGRAAVRASADRETGTTLELRGPSSGRGLELVRGRGMRSTRVPPRRRPGQRIAVVLPDRPHIEFVFRDRSQAADPPAAAGGERNPCRPLRAARSGGRLRQGTRERGGAAAPHRRPRRAPRARGGAGRPRRPEPAEPPAERRSGQREPDGPRRRAPGAGHRAARGVGPPG